MLFGVTSEMIDKPPKAALGIAELRLGQRSTLC